ncbi:MAG: Nif3-like dinuclear metal center hexameric protein [Phycisphaerae bacterium]
MRRGADARASDVLAAVELIAPLAGAAEWDNVGLLCGRAEWPASRVLLAIDLTDAVAREALRRRTQMLLVYHPPIFKGVRSVTPAAAASTTMLPDLLAQRVAVIAVHTALDAAPGGTNDLLVDMLDCVERWPLEPQRVEGAGYKLVVFVPPAEAPRLRAALSNAGAGVIGHYAECSFELRGRGTFLGDETTRPAIGQRGELETVEEARLEMVVPASRLGPVVRALYAAHSYEEPAFDLYPVHELRGRGQAGMGRVGRLRRPLRGRAIVEALRRRVDLSTATVVGDLRRRFARVTAAAGSFGASAHRDPDSLVITGELRHHEALELLARGVTAICLGHYASERPALAYLRRRLRALVPGAKVEVSAADRSPLVSVAE